jgi:hypothetical protein
MLFFVYQLCSFCVLLTTIGNSRWVQAMEWSGQKNFVGTPDRSFIVDGKEAGVLKSHGTLSFLKVCIVTRSL